MHRRIFLSALLLLLVIPASVSALSKPTISGITHASSASLLYTITGTGFAKGAKLLIGGSAPLSTWQGGTTFIVFQPPKGKTGTVDVQVTNPDGGKVVKKGGFTYPSSAIVPIIRGVAPNQNSIQNSTTLKTVWGSNFEKGAKVYVNNVLAPSQWQVGTQYIVFQPPAGTPSGVATVKVVNPGGGSASMSGNFTISTTVAYAYQTPTTYAYQTPTSSGGSAAFPMIGAYAIGTFEANYASDPWKEFAKHIDVAIIAPISATDSHGNSLRTALQEIKTANPTIKIAEYGYDISFPNQNSPFAADYVPTLLNNNWLSRTSWPDGPLFEVDGPGSKTYSFEPYPAGSLGTSGKGVGLTSNQYMAHWFLDAWLKNNQGGFAPSFSLGAYIYDLVDATFFDDTQANLRFQLDATRGQPFPAGTVGTTDIDKVNDLIQQGVVDRYAQTRAIIGKEAWLNATFVGNGGSLTGYYTPSRLQNLAPGGVLEEIDGSYDSYGFDPVRNSFIAGDQEIPGPSQVAGFNYIEADGSADLMDQGSSGGQSNFSGRTIPGKEGVLFWLATQLNFAPTIGGTFHASIPVARDGTGNYKPDDFVWHDIYSVDRNTGIPYTYPNVDAGRHYLGAALQDPQMLSPQSDGTYRREFQYGYAVVNPTNTAHQITFPQDVRIAGPGTLLPAGTAYSLPTQRGLIVVKVNP